MEYYKISLANIKQITQIKEVFINAKKHMIDENNLNQWKEIDENFVNSLITYIQNNQGYVVYENMEIVGFFALIYGEDKTYKIIKDGNWLNDDKYATIHKIAVKYYRKGIASFIVKFIENEINKNLTYNIRIDTHKDNISMNNFLLSNNFTYCGIISLDEFNDDDNLRNAYMKTIDKKIYCIANTDDFNEIKVMKNKVKERIIKENLPIWLNGYPRDEMLLQDIYNEEARIVKINNKIVAYAVFHHCSKEYDENTFKKNNLYSFGRLMVNDEYVGKHIGDFLVSKMIEEAKSLKVDGMGILVDSCNIKALNLYKKYGFVKEGEKQFPFAYLDIYSLYFM